MNLYPCARFTRLLPVAVVSFGLTCAVAADNKKPVPQKAVKSKTTATKAPASRPSMTVQRDPQSGGLVSGTADAGSSLVTGEAPAPVVTETRLSNGLVMATSSEGFMTTMTVTRNADGALSFDCKDGQHPKGPHSHAPKGKVQKNQGGER